MMKSKKTGNQTWSKQMVAAGIVSLTVIITATAGISYASMDLTGSMTSWFAKKTELVMQNLDVSMTSETEKQKELLKKELQLRLQTSSTNLEAFTEEQKQLRVEVLAQYAQDLLARTDIQSAQDREQVLSKLQAIVESAQAAMDTLASSYVAPSLLYIPTSPPQSTSVTEDVYGQLSRPTTVTEVTYNN